MVPLLPIWWRGSLRPAHLQEEHLGPRSGPAEATHQCRAACTNSLRPEALPGWCPASANSSDDGAMGVGGDATAAGRARGLLQGANIQAKQCA